PRIRTSSPGKTPVVFSKYATTVIREPCWASRTVPTIPANSTTMSATATTARGFLHELNTILTAGLLTPQTPVQRVRVGPGAVRPVPAPAVAGGTGSADRPVCR